MSITKHKEISPKQQVTDGVIGDVTFTNNSAALPLSPQSEPANRAATNNPQTAATNASEPASQQEDEDEAGDKKTTEDSYQPKARLEAEKVLQMARDGLLVELSIKRPSFTTRMDADDLAIETGNLSEKEQKALKEQFKLGNKKLLPLEIYRRLDAAENRARRNLYDHSFNYRDQTRGSRFVAGTQFEEWKEKNKEAEAEFWQVARDIEAQYPALCAELMEAYRDIAEFRWQNFERMRLAELLKTQEVTLADVTNLNSQKAKIIGEYLAKIQRQLPTLDKVKKGFSYTYRVHSLALPLEVAQNMSAAEELRRQDAAKEAQLRHKLELLRAEEQKQQAAVWAVRQVEQEKARLETEKERKKLELELEQLERSQKLQEEYFAQVQAQKEELLDSFWNNLIVEINSTIAQGARDVLDTLDANGGKLPPRSRSQLAGLLDKLRAFKDYLQDDDLAQKIEQLAGAIPPLADGKTKAHLETGPLRRVLTGMRREASAVLYSLETVESRDRDFATDLTNSVRSSEQIEPATATRSDLDLEFETGTEVKARQQTRLEDF